MSSDHFLGRKGAAACLIAGPIALALAAVFFGITNRSEKADWVAEIQDSPATAALGENFMVIGVIVTALALTWVTQHIARNGSSKARAFGSIGVMGLLCGLVFGGMNYATRQLAGTGEAGDVGRLVDRIYEGPEFTIAFLQPLLLLVGVVGLAVVGRRSGVLSTRQALGLGATVLFPVGIIGGVPIVAVAAFLALASVTIPFALELLREGTPTSVTAGQRVAA